MSFFSNAFLFLFVTAAVPLGVAGAWFSSQSTSAKQTAFQLHREVASLAATTVSRRNVGLPFTRYSASAGTPA